MSNSGSFAGIRRETNIDVTVVRRPPFSDNPVVGARGQRTRQRILEAALEVFGADGYHESSIDRITAVAGCSRVSFYQYFASKEDLFREHAAQLAREVLASVEQIEPVTAGQDGWSAIRDWLSRYGDIYDRYEAIFRASPVADTHTIALFRSKVGLTPLSPRLVEGIVALLLETATRTLDIASILRSAAADAYPPSRVNDALADVMHRALFLRRKDVNVRPADYPSPPVFELGSALLRILEQPDPAEDANAPLVLVDLLDAGREVFVNRGYHNTRIDDVVAAAGISHGAFYRYFENKDDLVRVLAARSLRAVSSAIADVPSQLGRTRITDRAAVRHWLRQYGIFNREHVPMIRVWVDAGLADDTLRHDRAAVFDWGRRRVRRALEGRRLGDIEIEALVMLALLEAFAARRPTSAQIDAALHVIEHGLALAD